MRWPLVRSLLASLAEDNFLRLVPGCGVVGLSVFVIWRGCPGTNVGGGTPLTSCCAPPAGASRATPDVVEVKMGAGASGILMNADCRVAGRSTPGSLQELGDDLYPGSSSTGRTGTPNAPRIFCDPGGRALHHITGRGGSVSLADAADQGSTPRRVNNGADCERPCLVCYRGCDGSRVGLRGTELLGTSPQLLHTARSTLPSWDRIGDLFPPPSLRCGVPA